MLSLIGRWLRALALGAGLRCPKCGQGKMFRSFLHVHQHCPHCNVKLQPYAGDSLGVYVVCYVGAVLPAILLAFVVGFFGKAGPYAVLATFAGVSSLVLFGFYRNMKGLWIALVYLMTGLRRNL